MEILEAIATRISARAFLDTPVSQDTVFSILERARMAPSGSNMQPWHIHAVTGQPLEQLIKKALAYATEDPVGNVRQEYQASRKTSSTHTNQGVLPVAWLYIQRLVSTVRTE